MTNKNASEPAYGFVDNRSSSYEDNEVHYGLTKRELIAAMAMQGMLANPEIIKIMTEAKVNPNDQADFLSLAAVEQGDSLLNQLSKP